MEAVQQSEQEKIETVKKGLVRSADLFSLICGNRIDVNIPLHDDLLTLVFGEQPYIEACHITSPDRLESLINLQHTYKHISCSTSFDNATIMRLGNKGMLTGGGCVVKMKGQLVVASFRDNYSLVDNFGKRWLRVKAIPDYVVRDYSIKDKEASFVIENELRKGIKSIIYSYYVDFVYVPKTKTPISKSEKDAIISNLFTTNHEAIVSELIKTLEGNVEIQRLIADEYINFIYKTFKKYKNFLKDVFYNPRMRVHKNGYDSYNEVILQDISILGVVLLPSYDHDIEILSLLEKNNIPYMILDSEESIRDSEELREFLKLKNQ